MRRRALALALAITPLAAHAQGSTRHVPLSIPEGQILRCTRANPPAKLTALLADGREFRIGPPEDDEITPPARSRVIKLFVDSLGAVRLLTEETSRDWMGGTVIFRAIQPDTMQSLRIDIETDSAELARVISSADVDALRGLVRQLPPRALTAQERTQADSLATWLWSRRCFRTP